MPGNHHLREIKPGETYQPAITEIDPWDANRESFISHYVAPLEESRGEAVLYLLRQYGFVHWTMSGLLIKAEAAIEKDVDNDREVGELLDTSEFNDLSVASGAVREEEVRIEEARRLLKTVYDAEFFNRTMWVDPAQASQP